MKIELIDTSSPYYVKSIALRHQVLRLPLGMDIKNDDLSDEPYQLHFVAIDQEEVLGVVVLKIEGKTGKLRQMAVSPDTQGQQVGRKLVNTLEQHAKNIKLNEIKLHARHYAEGFYQKLNYIKTTKPAFEEVGMKHFEMSKKL